jgi:hypothetical protein
MANLLFLQQCNSSKASTLRLRDETNFIKSMDTAGDQWCGGAVVCASQWLCTSQ